MFGVASRLFLLIDVGRGKCTHGGVTRPWASVSPALRPARAAAALLGRLFGTSRLVWNWARSRRTHRWAAVHLPDLGRVKLRRSETWVGRLRSVRLSRDGAGRYFASMCADPVPQAQWPELETEAVGIDLGVRDLAVASDGDEVRTVCAPKALQLKRIRLRRYQRRWSGRPGSWCWKI